MTQEALRMALDALEKNTKHLPVHFDCHFEAITAIKEALTQEALKLAMEALERFEGNKKLWPEAITAIKEALAQEQEPVKYSYYEPDGVHHNKPKQDTIQRLSALVRTQQITIDKLEAQTQEPVAHWSDCAVHSEPAYPKGECDCGGFNPTAWLVEDADGSHLYWTYKEPIGNEKWTPLYTTPPQEQQSCDKRTWVGLTDEEILAVNMSTVTKLIDEPIVCDTDHNIVQLGKAIEAKLKEKNT